MSQFKPPVNLLENVFRKQALYGARAKLIAKDETDPFLKQKKYSEIPSSPKFLVRSSPLDKNT